MLRSPGSNCMISMDSGKVDNLLAARQSPCRQKIIIQELESLDARIREMRADELISQLYIKFEQIKEREVRKALNRIAAGNETVDKVLEDFASSLTYKFLFEPTAALKEASREGDLDRLSAVGEMFNVEGVSFVSKNSPSKITHESSR